jgi:hypothetical protein
VEISARPALVRAHIFGDTLLEERVCLSERLLARVRGLVAGAFPHVRANGRALFSALVDVRLDPLDCGRILVHVAIIRHQSYRNAQRDVDLRR